MMKRVLIVAGFAILAGAATARADVAPDAPEGSGSGSGSGSGAKKNTGCSTGGDVGLLLALGPAVVLASRRRSDGAGRHT